MSVILAGSLAARGTAPPTNRGRETEIVWAGETPADLAPLTGPITKLIRDQMPVLIRQLDSPGWTPPSRVFIAFDASLVDVPACTDSAGIRLSVPWFRQHPDDLGAAVHEMVHVLQAYPAPRGSESGVVYTKPGWLVEGIADYLRWAVCCPESRALPEHFARRHYTEGYRTAAAFLDWIVRRHGGQTLRGWNAALRNGTFHEGLIEQATGRSLERLWAEFQAGRP